MRDIATHKIIKRIQSHGYIHALAFSPDGNYFVSAHGDNCHMALLWNREAEIEKALIGHEDSVTSIAISLDSQKIITGSADKTIKIWNMQNGSEEFTLSGHTDVVCTLAITPDGKSVISGSYDGTMKLWDIDKGQEPIFFSI